MKTIGLGVKDAFRNASTGKPGSAAMGHTAKGGKLDMSNLFQGSANKQNLGGLS